MLNNKHGNNYKNNFQLSISFLNTNFPKNIFGAGNNIVHIEHSPRPDANAKVILLHDVGTHGWQMSLILGHPLAFSQEVMKRLSVPHQTIMLPKDGHYPVEKEALDQL